MEPFKNVFSPELVDCFAGHLSRHLQGFDAAAFRAGLIPALDALELKARAQLLADALHDVLPVGIAARNAVMHAMLHPGPFRGLIMASDDKGIAGWGILPLTMVAGQHGLADFGGSMDLLRDMTRRFSSEFGVRYFLLADQDRALCIMRGWVDDPDHHVRRLVSEGTRPRLPWAMQLPSLMRDPSPVLPLLERLRDDPSDYVRRSVANHLNDISKDHPQLIAGLAADWAKGAGKARMALLRHACRSLIRQGDAAALAVFGHHKPEIRMDAPVLSSGTVRMGDTLEFSVLIQSLARVTQDLTVDYVMLFRKAGGRLAPKVFKGSRITLEPGASVTFRRRHVFQHVTTRVHYPGLQAVHLRVNGMDGDAAEFLLEADPALPPL